MLWVLSRLAGLGGVLQTGRLCWLLLVLAVFLAFGLVDV